MLNYLGLFLIYYFLLYFHNLLFFEKFYQNKSQKFQLFVDNSDKNTKEFFLFRKSKTNKINSVNIFKVENNFISEALYSDKVKFLRDKIILQNPFQLVNNKITKNKIIEKNYLNFTNEIKKNKVVSHLNNKYFYKLTLSSFLSFIFNFLTLYICFMIMIGKYVYRKTNDIGINFLYINFFKN